MSKPIYLSKADKEKALAEFSEYLDKTKLFDGKLEYKKSYYYPKQKDENGKEIDDRVTVVFSKVAKEKQDMLIREFSSEVAWNGIVRRNPDDPSVFYIEDIVIFPQSVTGATVVPDQKEYENWTNHDLTDDQRAHLRYHGHSHVNMATSPSGTDDQCQADILDCLCGRGLKEEKKAEFVKKMGVDAFYIFMIWNKRGDFNVRIYDLYDNTFYEGAQEVVIKVEGSNEMDGFLAEAKQKVKNKSYTYVGPSTHSAPAVSAPRFGSLYEDSDAWHQQQLSYYGYNY